MNCFSTQWHRTRSIIIGVGALFFVTIGSVSGQEIWTLESSVRRVQDVAPEIRMADAEIGIREGELTKAGAYPNPVIDVRADQKLGIDDGAGGTDLTLLAISQPIPIKRLSRQRDVASARLLSAQSQRRFQELSLEREAALAYHQLQLATEILDLAEQRLKMASKGGGSITVTSGDNLVRYLTPVERKRLDIVRENARQDVATAEGKFNEAVSKFRTLLLLPQNVQPKPTALTSMTQSESLAALESMLSQHALLNSVKQELVAANADVAAARSKRLADPVLSIFRERDVLAGSRQSYNGIMIGVQVPLWNKNNGGVAKAQSEVYKVQALLEARQRELTGRLRQSYLHLGHLIDQARNYQDRLLKPTEEVFKLTSDGFTAGELNVLALIDAYDTFFESRKRYLELLQNAWLEAAELRFVAGQSVLEPQAVSYNMGARP